MPTLSHRRRFRPTFRAFIAAFLSAAMLGETAFAYKPETSFWTDRRTSKPVILASAAPAPFAGRPDALRSVLADIAPATVTPSVRALSARLPAGFLSEVQIKKVIDRPGKAPVILLEDVHQNVEAQTHISSALRALGAEPGATPVSVALEGAVGGFRFDAFHHFPDPATATAVADSFLASGDLGGPSHAGFTAFPVVGARGLRFLGADDAVHYVRNVAAYHEAAGKRAEARAAVDKRAAELAARRAAVFSPALRAFDAAAERHHRGDMPLADFAAVLARSGVPVDPVLTRFLDACRMERALDLGAVERERRAVLEKLVAKLSEKDTRALVDLTLGYREGAVSFGGYYAALDGFCRRSGVNLAATPHFQDYLRYVLLSDGIDADALFSAVDAAETAAYARLAKTSDARTLVASLRQVRRAGRIVDFALSSSEWSAYQANRAALAGLDLSPFEAFYKEADARNAALVAAATAATGTSVLVAGGFHTEAVAGALAKSGRPVVVCSPRLTKADGSVSAYLSVFDREKTPLERMFAGEKLFLAGVPAGSLTPPIPMPDPTADMANETRALIDDAGGDAAAANRAAAELGAPANGRVSRDGGTTTVTSDVPGGKVVTEVAPEGAESRHGGEPASRHTVGKREVTTYTDSTKSDRSFANRMWLSLPGAAMVVASAAGLVVTTVLGLASAPAVMALTAATALGAAWMFPFLRDAFGILRARNGEMRYPLIVEMHGHDLMEANRRGAVAAVAYNRVILNPHYFDFVHNRSRLTPAQQMSILIEELRHLRYRRERGLLQRTSRTIPSLIREEFFVNMVMPLQDFFTGRADSVEAQRHETSVDLSLMQERARLRALLEKLMREKQQPGSQDFEQVVFISDQHGAIDAFDDFLMDAILRSVPLRGIERVDAEGEWTPARIDELFSKAAASLAPQPELAIEEGASIESQMRRLEYLRGRAYLTNLAALTDGKRFPPEVVARAKEYIDAGFDFHLNPDEAMGPQLERFGVRLSDLKGKIFFHNLGDFMDRGKYGIKIFLRSKELIEAKLSDFVVGNHDLWTMMNLMGIHLPFYEGYDFHGYNDGPEFAQYGDINEVLTAHHRADEAKETARNRTWWAARLAEYVRYHEDRQKTYWGPNVDERMKAFYAEAKPVVDRDPKLVRLWGEVRGNLFETDVYTGTRSVGQMSFVWWRDTLKKFKAARDAMPAPTNDEERRALAAWDGVIKMIQDDILPVVKADLKTALDGGTLRLSTGEEIKGGWWWRAFEAMNNQNYTSAEWWAKDWIFHDKWGPSVLKELNEILEAENRRRSPDQQLPKVTNANYLDNQTIMDAATFFKENFTLFLRDDHQNTMMHAFLPVDMDKFIKVDGRDTDRPNPGYGEFFFTYKGVTYRGKGRDGYKSVWEGLSLIQDDVRKGRNLSDLMEAFQLVNSWYADNTTLAKPSPVADAIAEVGEELLAEKNGFNRLGTGHIPLQDFQKQKRKEIPGGFLVGKRLFFIDHGMGERFGSRGGYVVSSPNKGFNLFGREFDKDKGILTNPRTMKNEKVPGEGSPGIMYENRGIAAPVYLDTLILNVGTRLQEIEQTLSGGMAARSLGNRVLLTVGFVAGLSAFVFFGDPLRDVLSAIGALATAAGMLIFARQAFSIAYAYVRAGAGAAPGALHWAVARYADLRYPYTEAGVVLGGRIHLNRTLLAQMSIRQQRSVIAEELRHLRYQRRFGLVDMTNRGFFSIALEEIAVNFVMPVIEIFRPDPEIAALKRAQDPKKEELDRVRAKIRAMVDGPDQMVVITQKDFETSIKIALAALNGGRERLFVLRGIPEVYEGDFRFDGHPKIIGLSREVLAGVGIDMPASGILDPSGWTDAQKADLKKKILVLRTRLAGLEGDTDAFRLSVGRTFGYSDDEIRAREISSVKGAKRVDIPVEGQAKPESVYTNTHIYDLRVIPANGGEPQLVTTYRNSPIVSDDVNILGVGPQTVRVWSLILGNTKHVVVLGQAPAEVQASLSGKDILTVKDPEIIAALTDKELWKPTPLERRFAAGAASKKVIDELTPSPDALRALQSDFENQTRAGLAGHSKSIEMIRTDAKLPRGDERQFTIAVDWGGSTARVSLWELRGNGEVAKVATLPDYLFTEADKQNPRGLYPMLADKIDELIGKLPAADGSRKFNVVVGFAFPPSHWSKGWSDPNGLKPMSQTELKDSLNAEFERRGRANLSAEKGENDTVGPMVMETYARRASNPDARPATISVILGTGHNVAALIDGVIRNFESGAYDGVRAISTSMDAETDRNQRNPGEHLLEKMVAGGFLGETLRAAIARLNAETGQFAWNPAVFGKPNAVSSKLVSDLAATNGNRDALQAVLRATGVTNASDNEADVAYRLSEAILNRSARLVAMELAVTIRLQDPELRDSHIITFEGSVYDKAPRYPERVRAGLVELLGKDAAGRVELVSNKGREGAGTAVMAATAGAAAERSIGNRIGLAAVGAAMVLASVTGLAVMSGSHDLSFGVLSALLAAAATGLAMFVAFVRQAAALGAARRGSAPTFPLIRELSNARTIRPDRNGPAATVVDGNLLLNPWYFDLSRGVSTLSPREQRSLLREEQWHIRLQRALGLAGMRGRVSVAVEELVVNVVMPVTDPIVAAVASAYRWIVSSIAARRWIAEGRRYSAGAAGARSDADLVNALYEAGPHGLFFGRVTANDRRNAALLGFARAAAQETNRTQRALQWTSLAGYRRAVDAGRASPSVTEASQTASAGVSTRVEVYHFNQVGASALPSELAEFRALVERARADRAEGRMVSVIAAVSGELPEDVAAQLSGIVSTGAGFATSVPVTDDLRSDNGVAYSYEKLLDRALAESDLDAVRALVTGSYYNAAFVTYSKIPSQFLADGRLRAIWTVLANIGAGWAPLPVDTLLRAAEMVKEQA